jgi:uncharacterized protein
MVKHRKHSLVRDIISITIIIIFWEVIGNFFRTKLGALSPYFFDISIFHFILSDIPNIFFILGIFFSIKFIHNSQFFTIISANYKLNYRKIIISFTSYLFLLVLTYFIYFLISPKDIIFSLDFKKLLYFIPFCVIFTIIQCCSEEFFFRGFLLQVTSRYVKPIPLLLIINGLFFIIVHLRIPEFKQMPYSMCFYYFFTGLLYSFVTIKDNGIEIPIAIHTANNIFTALILNWQGSVMSGTYSIFILKNLSQTFCLISFPVAALLYLYFIDKLFQLKIFTHN